MVPLDELSCTSSKALTEHLWELKTRQSTTIFHLANKTGKNKKMKRIFVTGLQVTILTWLLTLLFTGCATTHSTALTIGQISVKFEVTDKSGRQAQTTTTLELRSGVSGEASQLMLLALHDFSLAQSNLMNAARDVMFTDATETGAMFGDFCKAVAKITLGQGAAFPGGSIIITVYRTTGLDAGAVMCKWDEHKSHCDYYVRPGFNPSEPFARTASAEDAFSHLVWKRPASQP